MKTKASLSVLIFTFMVWSYIAFAQLIGMGFEKVYTYMFFAILYGMISIASVIILQWEKLSKKDWILAIIFGVLASGNAFSIGVPEELAWRIHLMGAVAGITTFFVFLACISLRYDGEEEMRLIAGGSQKEILLDILSVVLAGMLFYFFKGQHTNGWMGIGFYARNLISPLGAGVSEEIMFRLFPYMIFYKVGKGEVSKPFLFLVMVVPFTLVHTLDSVVCYGWGSAVAICIPIGIIAVVLSVIALKRDVFTAMGVHAMYDFILAVA